MRAVRQKQPLNGEYRPNADVDTFRWVAAQDGTVDVDLQFDRANGDIVQAGNSTNTILFDNITAVPEPSTTAMALAGLACGGYSLFRRRKRA